MTTEIYTLSLHDALPIYGWQRAPGELFAADGRARAWLRRGVESGEPTLERGHPDRKSTRLNSSHLGISYAVFCLKKKKQKSKYDPKPSGIEERHLEVVST